MLPVLQALTGYPAAFIILNAFDLYVPGGVYVSVEIGLALGALPESVRQFEVIVDVAADMTGLGRGEISVGIKQQLASLFHFVLQKAGEKAIGVVVGPFAQIEVLGDLLHVKIFHAYDIVFIGDLCGQFMQVVHALILYLLLLIGLPCLAAKFYRILIHLLFKKIGVLVKILVKKVKIRSVRLIIKRLLSGLDHSGRLLLHIKNNEIIIRIRSFDCFNNLI